ncbi:MAG: UDP-N-acetylmuramoyl-L-alanine--D-glutamate ligase [Burkholderiales bacterium]|nr:UDP-N-acetylmuramoyl-L-alanine--D-glutamate ligase [Burkholderiales bacterium]
MTSSGKRVLVLGLGETGLSMAQWLAREAAAVRVADTRVRPPARDALAAAVPQAEVLTGPFAARLLEGVDELAVSPGVPLADSLVREAAARGLPVYGDIELFARALPADARPKVIAVTGTNGKSTVTALTGAICRAAGLDTEVAGNIGPAALAALMRRRATGRDPEVWVLELSSFQLETTRSLDADAATVLNVSEDHLDRYAGIAEYAAAKARVFAGRGVQVLNRDDGYSRAMALPARRVVTFGLGTPRDHDDFGLVKVLDQHWLAQGMTPLVGLRDLPLAGLHNAANAMAAIALAKAIGCRCTEMLPALRAFRGLPHRMERVADVDGVVFYDDSKGTNVGAAVAALDGIAPALGREDARIVLIAGGEGKRQDFGPLRAAVGKAARCVVLIGRDAALIAAALEGSGVPALLGANMHEAVERAFRAARPGDAVLLSPACASFDMFDNYAHRGAVFRAAVEDLERAAAH